MSYLFVGFLVSWLVTLFVVRFNHIHTRFTADYDLIGVQKFHSRPTPRVGGVSLIFGLCTTVVFSSFYLPNHISHGAGILALCAMPAFGGGLVEDLTKRVGVLHRLAFTALSAALGFWFLNAGLRDVDTPLLDILMAFAPISFVFTCFAVAGVANSINLIDGYNGLASMVSAMIFAALAYVGYQVGDDLIWLVSLAMLGSILGFFVWNYPRGSIFLGDGGAYLIGFMIGELSVLLLVRNPQVSTWLPLLLVFYPVFETLFTIYRRMVVRKSSPGLPDAVHMHQMVYMRLVRWAVGSRCADEKTMRNSMTAPYMWLLCSLSIIPALLFWENQTLLQVCTVGFAVIYVLLYRALVRFHAPRLLVRKRPPVFAWWMSSKRK